MRHCTGFQKTAIVVVLSLMRHETMIHGLLIPRDRRPGITGGWLRGTIQLK
jgi:hypothetical protein